MTAAQQLQRQQRDSAEPGAAGASPMNAAIRRAIDRLLADQQDDGHWIYELEADATIPAEYVCYLHYMNERAPELEREIASFLIDEQQEDGSGHRSVCLHQKDHRRVASASQ